jgi:hypothetical protein
MEFKSTKEIVSDIRTIGDDKLSIALFDIGDKPHQYMHEDRFSTARKMFSLTDVCQNVFNLDAMHEAAESHIGAKYNRETVEDAFIEVLNFAQEVQDLVGEQFKQCIQNSHGYYVGGISCRGQLVIGLYNSKLSSAI